MLLIDVSWIKSIKITFFTETVWFLGSHCPVADRQLRALKTCWKWMNMACLLATNAFRCNFRWTLCTLIPLQVCTICFPYILCHPKELMSVWCFFMFKKIHLDLCGGFKCICLYPYFIWGRCPIWGAYFSNGLVQPPTSDCPSYFLYWSRPSTLQHFGIWPGWVLLDQDVGTQFTIGEVSFRDPDRDPAFLQKKSPFCRRYLWYMIHVMIINYIWIIIVAIPIVLHVYPGSCEVVIPQYRILEDSRRCAIADQHTSARPG